MHHAPPYFGFYLRSVGFCCFLLAWLEATQPIAKFVMQSVVVSMLYKY
jgi:hypothetical protein